MDVLETCLWPLGGYVTRTVKTTKCDDSKRAFTMKQGFHKISEVELLNCKTRGRVFRPSAIIFRLMRATDTEFTRIPEQKFLSDRTIDHMLETGIFKCRHKGCICFKTLYYICQSSNAARLHTIIRSSKEKGKVNAKGRCRNLFQIVTVILQGTPKFCIVMLVTL